MAFVLDLVKHVGGKTQHGPIWIETSQTGLTKANLAITFGEPSCCISWTKAEPEHLDSEALLD